METLKQLEIGLNSRLISFCDKYQLVRNDNKQLENAFEHFVNYVISSVMLEEEIEEFNYINTNLSEGIDGITIIINDRLIKDEADLKKIGENEKLKIKLGFIQTTLQKSFESKKLKSFIDSVVNFLTFDLNIEPFSTICQMIFDIDGDFRYNLDEKVELYMYYVSGLTNHSLEQEILEKEKEKISKRSDMSLFNVKEISFLQSSEIKDEFEKIQKFHRVDLTISKNTQLKPHSKTLFSLLSTISYNELKKLVLTKDGKLKDNLFVENVRNYIGNSNVNIAIKKTLEDDIFRDYFPYLNNGITIMCDEVKRHGTIENSFTLTFPRIINGCQTTNILFEHFKESDSEVEIVAKIISTCDEDLKKKIIFAANNQNTIEKDMKSLNDYYEKIDEFFNGFNFPIKLYFERLRGLYRSINPPYSKINIENLARVYISVFLREPHIMKSNAIGKIEEYQKSKKIFNSENEIEKYFYCALLFYYLNYFQNNNVIKLVSKSMDMHLLMAISIVMEEKMFSNITQKINHLSDIKNAENIFNETNIFLNNLSYLFERRGFYSGPKTRKLIESLEKFKDATNN